MRRKLVISLSILVLAGVSLAYLQIDDDPIPERQRMLASIKTDHQNPDSYYYLMGISAGEGNDPLQVGKNRVTAILAAKTTAPTGQKFVFTDILEAEKLPEATGSLFCRTWEGSCLNVLGEASASSLNMQLKTHATLLKRYQTLMALPEGSTLTQPEIEEPIPPYSYLSSGSRLVSFKALERAQRGESAEAIDDLINHIIVVRKHLAAADNIVGKMIYLNNISSTLDVIGLLTAKLDRPLTTGVHPLTPAERDLSAPMARELATVRNMMLELDRHPELLEIGGHLPGWIGRLLFKPEMSINAVFTSIAPIGPLSRQESPEMLVGALALQDKTVQVSRFKNYLGSVLLDAGKYPDTYLKYLYRIHDLNGKIVLLNARLKSGTSPVKWETVPNPYYGLSKPARRHPQFDAMCFDGPKDDERRYRCLMLKPAA